MRFGPVDLDAAAGAFLGHSVSAGGEVLRKGTRLGDREIAALRAGGLASVVVARLELDDVAEDEAAGRLAQAIEQDHLVADRPFTGRANLRAAAPGLLLVDREAVDRFNRIDPAITLATLREFAPVERGQLVATVKIIPFAVSGRSLEAAEALARQQPVLAVSPYRPKKVGLVATRLPSLKISVMEKTRERLAARLADSGSTLKGECRVPHEAGAVGEALARLAAEGADLLVVFGASAMVDAGDVVPAGIAAAGGQILRLGMPVDPGNLLVLADLGGIPVIGAPGCARSPKENGFDWILHRLLAGLTVTSDDIASLGVGGLLGEIGTRPQPREKPQVAGGVTALILAGGEGRRMGGPNKLLAELGGRSLVRRVAEAALASRATPVLVVTGHRHEAIEVELSGLDLRLVLNEAYAGGLSTSLRRGVEALPVDAAAVLVLLADMPFVTPAILDRLVHAFEAAGRHPIVVPTHAGKRGNPVLWPRRFFGELQRVEGDTGARRLIGAHADDVVEIEIGEAVALDLDTPEAIEKAGGRIVP